MTKLEKRPKPPDPEKLQPEDVIREIGKWYWVKSKDGDWLGTIIYVGSNYVEVQGVERDGCSTNTERVHEAEFDEILTPEPNYDTIIRAQIDGHKKNVDELMNKVKQLTSKLGIFRAELPEDVEPPSNALVVAHQTQDIQAHKRALIKAKEKTLPELFEKIKVEHAMMAGWMKAQLIPLQAESEVLKRRTSAIEDRIFTVELYAGLIEELARIQDGKPADDLAKIHLMQRRHYMDEECLVNYEAGGMEYKSLKEFDTWLLRRENLARILPHPRCIVAFRIRRNRKERQGYSLNDFIRIQFEEKLDAQTFLYIRNGEQVYRLMTGIDFGSKLFPDREKSTLLGQGKVWLDLFWSNDPKVRSQREYENIMADHRKAMDEYEKELAEWKAATPAERKSKNMMKPWGAPSFHHKFVPCTPDSVYYDDAMRKIARAAIQHNRVAVVLQGLLDRSPAFHPHPPWQLWTPEGFNLGIELVYDSTRVLTTGDKPNFLAYVAKLNESLERGSFTIGQERLWAEHEAEKENARRRGRGSRDYYNETYYPYGNPGPGLVAKVIRLGRDGTCTFEWQRERERTKWIDDPDPKSRYMKRDDSKLRATFSCSGSLLMNVTAYKPGDFRRFFNDPRTRAEYLRWAPFLLAAEDWHAGKLKANRCETKRLDAKGESDDNITEADDDPDDE